MDTFDSIIFLHIKWGFVIPHVHTASLDNRTNILVNVSQ